MNYSGPAYASFGEKIGFDYTLEYFKKCIFSEDAFEIIPSESWGDDKWYLDQEKRSFDKNNGCLVLNEGEAEGTLLGANLCTFNLFQGTEYFPNLENSVLFLEDDESSDAFLFDRDLQSLIHQTGFEKVKGIVIGRFQKASKMTDKFLTKIIKTKKELVKIPVIANADFGHTQPMITFPIGGDVEILAKNNIAKLKVLRH